MSYILLWRFVAIGMGLLAFLVAILAVSIIKTAAPVLPPLPLPTATAQPGPLSQLAAPHAPAAGINTQVYQQLDTLAGKVNLHYQAGPSFKENDSPCLTGGYWSLTVNTEEIIAHPFATGPSRSDWEAAAQILQKAEAICTASVIIIWLQHQKAYSLSDKWLVSLPATSSAFVSGSELYQYSTEHGRQL